MENLQNLSRQLIGTIAHFRGLSVAHDTAKDLFTLRDSRTGQVVHAGPLESAAGYINSRQG